ncbi:MAG: MFS transporter [Candidatus Sericytochromatia bacterium]|nr:MFS transporter [Candidatus Sericytochromatia bacterium]
MAGGSGPPFRLDRLDLIACTQAAAVHAALPVLPLVARSAGGGTATVSAMVTASMLAGLATQLPGGWWSDRVGRRPVLLVGLWLHASVAALFLLGAGGLGGLVPLRALEGVAAALSTTSALALAAEAVGPGERGRRVARLAGAQSAGYALGPALGVPFLAWGYQGTFAAALCLAILSLLLLPGLKERSDGIVDQDETRPDRGVFPEVAATPDWPVVAMLAWRALGGGLVVGMYEATWADYMVARGAGGALISASWAIFALPPLLFAPWVGRQLDRMGASRPLVVGSGLQAIALATYPFWPGPAWPLAGCVLEGLGFAWSMPAHQVLSVQAAPAAVRGRILGFLGACFTAGVVAGAWFFPWFEALFPGRMFFVAALALMLPALPFMLLRRLPVRYPIS